MPTTLDIGRRLLAIAKTGLHYTENAYERERYEEVVSLAAELLAMDGPHAAESVREAWRLEDGYVTPKLDVRGAVFRGDQVLLVRERSDGKWTLPGGFADINEWPSLSVTKEIEQESGYTARVIKLAAVYDRNKHNAPRYLFHIWKLFFICEITGGEARESIETDGVEFFSIDELPELSTGRSTAAQIRRMYEHALNPALPAEFD